jgi:hypothetical protein
LFLSLMGLPIASLSQISWTTTQRWLHSKRPSLSSVSWSMLSVLFLAVCLIDIQGLMVIPCLWSEELDLWLLLSGGQWSILISTSALCLLTYSQVAWLQYGVESILPSFIELEHGIWSTYSLHSLAMLALARLLCRLTSHFWRICEELCLLLGRYCREELKSNHH